jgi:hypothetical protein
MVPPRSWRLVGPVEPTAPLLAFRACACAVPL